MPTTPLSNGNRAARRRKFTRSAVLTLALLAVTHLGEARTAASTTLASTSTPTPTPVPAAEDSSPAPLSERERAMLELIKGLQERVTRLEAQVAAAAAAARPAEAPAATEAETLLPGRSAESPLPSSTPDGAKPSQDDEEKEFGKYTPNLGFKLAETEYGDLSVSIYTYARYLNQLGLAPTYVDAFGNTKNVQERQDIQLQKLQIKFLGWMLTPKLRYFLYAWTSNATQGQGAQVVLAGNLNYQFNKHLTLGGGIKSLPGTRSVEGNFPFWPGVDSRMIADEFMRPSYTSGFWATGNITDRLKYQVMLGNNMSTLGVPATRLDRGLNTLSTALLWFPTGDYEKNFTDQGWGDFEGHEQFSTRFGFHFSRSDENRESQPGSDVFENTQLRLSDGTVIFTPNLFGPDTTITDARWRMTSLDGAFKYRGYALEGEYYLRWLDNFRGTNTAGIPRIFDQGFQLQGSAMIVPKRLQLYLGHSRIFGDYGDPWDARAGANWFPWRNKVVRWNTEWLYLYRSPVGYSSVPFAVGGRGNVFHTSVELAF